MLTNRNRMTTLDKFRNWLMRRRLRAASRKVQDAAAVYYRAEDPKLCHYLDEANTQIRACCGYLAGLAWPHMEELTPKATTRPKLRHSRVRQWMHGIFERICVQHHMGTGRMVPWAFCLASDIEFKLRPKVERYL